MRFLGRNIDLENLRKRLDLEGIPLDRLARVVSEEDPPLLVFLPNDMVRADSCAAFLATSHVARPRLPRLGNGSIEWVDDLPEGDISVVLVPIVKNGSGLCGPSALSHLIERLHFERRVTIGPHAEVVTNGDVLDKLVHAKQRATENVATALQLVKTIDQGALDLKEGIFDHKSGAVFFEPDKWRDIGKGRNSRVESRLLEHFTQRLPDAWSPAHPCYSRVLFTPTKVLLRGEAYYINMRRESPFRRFRQIVEEMEVNATLAYGIKPDLEGKLLEMDDWKLVLALLDQIRNIALQTFSFLHVAQSVLQKLESSASTSSLLNGLRDLCGDERSGAHGFLRHSIRAYYGWLLHKDGAVQELVNAVSCFNGDKVKIAKMIKKVRKYAHKKNVEQSSLLADLVRGWREADHPGESLMTSLIAADKLKDERELIVVGIGWGGIELPLTFDYVASLLPCSHDQARRLYIVRYSHYRSDNSDLEWYSFPVLESGDPQFEGIPAALLDDNTLTGLTLEQVRDALLLNGSGAVHMFVTRYSGERRHAHMQMDDHGVIDPEVLINQVNGYLGETPFSRSWSTKKKDYKNQVGVFSLARRRILECIYNNSTVELYSREGF